MAISLKFANSLKPKMNFGAAKMTKLPKLPKISMKAPKMPGDISTKPFSHKDFWKAPKLPKSPKVKILKMTIKKFKK